MIQHYKSRGGTIELYRRNELIPDKNIFSILVGKNGTGKSTLLGSLTDDLSKEIMRHHRHNEYKDLINHYDDYTFLPSQIIAISTSPFDKFPIDRFKRIKNYSYLGLRDVNSTSMGLGYLSKIISSLIESISADERQAIEISNVLEFLEFKDKIYITLDFTITSNQAEEILKSNDILKEFDNRENTLFRRVNRQFFTNSDETLNIRKFSKFQKIISEYYYNDWNPRRTKLVIERYGFSNHKEDIDNIIFLFNAGFIRLRDVVLTKRNNESYSIKDASSGEQSIILGILGIASKIKDGSLILIDEPEICLHPQWQEKYIDILTDTFDKYRKCQFIIATHSPLIISRLSNYNSFIVDMETETIKNAENYINNSVDFQLANVFNHPGFKNEYLLRIAMNIFSNLSKNKSFGKSDLENLQILENQSHFLKENDPVYDLYKTIVQLKKLYK